MTGGFVAIALGLCAAMISHAGQDVVAIGRVVGDACDPLLIVGDTDGSEFRALGHLLRIETDGDVAVVTVDGAATTIQRTRGL